MSAPDGASPRRGRTDGRPAPLRMRGLALTYGALLWLGTATLASGVGVGMWESWRTDGGLPPLALSDVVENYLAEVDALLEAGDADRAAEQAALVLRLLSGNRHLSHHALGRALAAQGRLDEAIEQYRKALEIDPDLAIARNNLAVAYARQQRWDDALVEARRAVDSDPAYEAARRNLERLERRVAATTAPAEGLAPDERDLGLGDRYARQFYRGELDELAARFSPALSQRLPAEQLRGMRETVAAQLGHERDVLAERIVPGDGGARLYVRRARFERHDGEVELVVQLAGDATIDGLLVRPAGTP